MAVPESVAPNGAAPPDPADAINRVPTHCPSLRSDSLMCPAYLVKIHYRAHRLFIGPIARCWHSYVGIMVRESGQQDMRGSVPSHRAYRIPPALAGWLQFAQALRMYSADLSSTCPFALLWAGQTISVLGDAVFTLLAPEGPCASSHRDDAKRLRPICWGHISKARCR